MVLSPIKELKHINTDGDGIGHDRRNGPKSDKGIETELEALKGMKDTLVAMVLSPIKELKRGHPGSDPPH